MASVPDVFARAFDQLGLEGALAVAGSGFLDLVVLVPDRLLALAVAGIAGAAPGGIVSLIAQSETKSPPDGYLHNRNDTPSLR